MKTMTGSKLWANAAEYVFETIRYGDLHDMDEKEKNITERVRYSRLIGECATTRRQILKRLDGFDVSTEITAIFGTLSDRNKDQYAKWASYNCQPKAGA